MRVKSVSLCLFLSLLGYVLPSQVHAQIFEPFSVRYLHVPFARVSNSPEAPYADAERETFRLLETTVRFPVKFGQSSSFVVPEITYKTYFQNYEQWPEVATTPERAHHFRVFFKGVFAINDRWNILGLGGFAQGLNRGVGLSFPNTFYRIGGGFLKDLSSGNQFGATLLYIQEARLVLPIIIYKGASANGKWQFDIEGPRAVIERSVFQNSRLRYEQKLDNDRISLNGESGSRSPSYSYTHLNLSVGLSQRIKGPVFANLSAGLSPLYLLTLYDGDNTAIETLQFQLQPSISASIYVSVNPKDYVD